jgi:hypothetical protein
MTTPADELRTAAQMLRSLAEAATPGPWRQHDTHLGQYGHTATVLSGEGNASELRAWLPSFDQESWSERRNVWADAAYISAVHPGVGLALADWLDHHAAMSNRLQSLVDGAPDGRDHPALAVARAINGGQQ